MFLRAPPAKRESDRKKKIKIKIKRKRKRKRKIKVKIKRKIKRVCVSGTPGGIFRWASRFAGVSGAGIEFIPNLNTGAFGRVLRPYIANLTEVEIGPYRSRLREGNYKITEPIPRERC